MILVLITLISLCTHAVRGLHVWQPYRVEAHGGEARLRCSYRAPGGVAVEMRLALYRGPNGDDRVCLLTLNATRLHPRADDGPVHCQGELAPGGVDLTVSGLRGVDTDLYRCRLEVFYPPPYLLRYGNGTIVYVPEKSDCLAPEAQAQDEPRSTQVVLAEAALAVFILILIVIVVTLSIYKFFTMSQTKKNLFSYENFQYDRNRKQKDYISQQALSTGSMRR